MVVVRSWSSRPSCEHSAPLALDTIAVGDDIDTPCLELRTTIFDGHTDTEPVETVSAKKGLLDSLFSAGIGFFEPTVRRRVPPPRRPLPIRKLVPRRVLVTGDDQAQFAGAVTALRWSTLAIAIALAALTDRGDPSAIAVLLLTAYTLWRTFRPIATASAQQWPVRWALLSEVAGVVVLVLLTGSWRSPFLVNLAASAALAGFVGGWRIVCGVAVIAATSVAVQSSVVVGGTDARIGGLQFATELVLVGMIGGFSRHLLDQNRRNETDFAHRLDHLDQMNRLLLAVHGAATDATVPLDLPGASTWVLEQLERELYASVRAVALWEPGEQRWHIAASSRSDSTDDVFLTSIPPGIELAAATDGPVVLEDLAYGLCPTSVTGAYVALRARRGIVGALIVEWDAHREITADDRSRLQNLADAATLAVDNAQRLSQIQVLATEQERARLARELHDHVGQSLVYIGLELDRLATTNAGRATGEEILSLRSDLTHLVSELRDTLVELRTDISEERDLSMALTALAQRICRRSALQVDVTGNAKSRLPVGVEREIWRIAQEATTNVERHARASRLTLSWQCDASRAVLEVADDGIGLVKGLANGPVGFGIRGMRERAAAIGAELQLLPGIDHGTTVRMTLGTGEAAL